MRGRFSILLFPVFILVFCRSLPAIGGNAKDVTKDEPIIAYIFLSPDCPISQKAVPDINELSRKYKGKVVFKGVIPVDVNDDTLKSFCKEYAIPFDVAKDTGCYGSRKYEITIVPQAVVIGHDGEILYTGLIDNAFVSVGKRNHQAYKPILENALKAIFKNEKPSPEKTEPVGCMVHCKS